MVNNWLIYGHCPLCASPMAGDRALCPDCEQTLPSLTAACPVCALPMVTRHSGPCGECLADPPAFERIRTGLRYQHPINELVAHFKYHHHLPSGRLLAQLIASGLGKVNDIDLLIPMPLHASRLQQRGFNQAAELCRLLSKQLGIPWRSDLLQRTKPASAQREAKRRQRWANVRNAFACKPSKGRIAIIDDVVTTGATARAAARSVKKAGAERVEIWAVARTPRPGDKT